MLMIPIVVTLSIGIVLLVIWATRVEREIVGMFGVVLFTGAAFPILAHWLFLQGVLTLLFWVSGCRAEWPRVWKITTSVVCLTVFLSLSFWQGLSSVARNHALKAEFPLQSLRERLSYETAEISGTLESFETIKLASSVEQRLSDSEISQEVYEGRFNRRFWLHRLHERTHTLFLMSEGFGETRMLRVTPKRLELESVVPIPVVSDGTDPLEYDPENPPLNDHFSRTVPKPSAASAEGFPAELHHEGVELFLAPDRIGYVQDLDHVAGFQPHGFYERGKNHNRLEAGSLWRVTKVQLVSLLKHETPMAYISKDLPRMDQLAKAETRPLNEFEQQTLSRLHTEEDLVTEEGENRIRMLGAIRAGTSCLECHSVQRGELLGAFSYELRRPWALGDREPE